MDENLKAAIGLVKIFALMIFAIAFLGSLFSFMIDQTPIGYFPKFFLNLLIHPLSLACYFFFMILPIVWAWVYGKLDRRRKQKLDKDP